MNYYLPGPCLHMAKSKNVNTTHQSKTDAFDYSLAGTIHVFMHTLTAYHPDAKPRLGMPVPKIATNYVRKNNFFSFYSRWKRKPKHYRRYDSQHKR